MKPTERTCDPQRIDDYLDERLSEALAIEFERHLCDCEHCRNELQKRSAEPDVWRDAAVLLGRDSTINPSLSSSSQSLRSGSRRSYENDSSSSGEQTTDEHKTYQRERYVLSVLDSLAPTDDPEMLGRVGDYEISGVVGVGGMGAVLKGFDKSLRRVVAIKVMAPHLAHSGSARTRFQREARAAAAITHDNVIDIYAVSEAAGLPYLVMPYARGPSLQKRIDEGGPLGVVEVVRIGRQIAAGLAAAHEQGVVHRDIKPANILLSDGIERLWITDFGVARAMDDASMTQTGVIAGTPQYMSPEQARGESVDHRSDLFSLGSVLYTACTGRPPFRSEAAYGILRRITDSDPRPIREINSDIPEWLCIIIERLLAKHPADRFESASEVVDLFDGCLAHLQQPLQVELPQSLRGKPTVHDTSSPLAEAIEQKESKRPFAPLTQQTQPTLQPQRSFSNRGLIMIGSILAATFLGLLTMQMTNPTDISGHWTGDNWQHVSLASVNEASDWYSGTFVDSSGRRGAVRLEWSRLQRRYTGRWKVGEAEAGEITLRAGENGTLRGAVSVDPESQLEPGVPRLLEFAWKTASQKAQQDFESFAARPQSTLQESARQSPRSVSIKSPTQGIIVRMADGIELNARVKPGDVIAEMDTSASDAVVSLRRRLSSLELDEEAAKSKIVAAERGLYASRQISDAIMSQIKNLETVKQRAAEAFKAGNGSQAEELHAQSNADNALVTLKKAEADVIKLEAERELANVQFYALKQQRDEIMTEMFQASRMQILASVAGQITYLATLSESDTVKEGDLICEVTPDSTESPETPESTKPTVAIPTTVPDKTPAATASTATTTPVAEPDLSNSLQILSAFGTASDLAKRLRELRQKLERLDAAIEAGDAKLTAVQKELLELQEKLSQVKEDDVLRRTELKNRVDSIDVQRQLIEEEIKALTADREIARAEQAEAESERSTIIEILHTQLLAAQSQLDSKHVSRASMEQQNKQGMISQDELNRAEQVVAEATSELRQLELLTEFYAKLGQE
jgi:serine/threonine protein kinase/multidrug resistance efflux pump